MSLGRARLSWYVSTLVPFGFVSVPQSDAPGVGERTLHGPARLIVIMLPLPPGCHRPSNSLFLINAGITLSLFSAFLLFGGSYIFLGRSISSLKGLLSWLS